LERFLQSTAWPHPSIAKPLESTTGHIKVTCPLVDSSCRHGKR